MAEFKMVKGQVRKALTLRATIPGMYVDTVDGRPTGIGITAVEYVFGCDCGKEYRVWSEDLPSKEKDWPVDCGCGKGETGRVNRGAPPKEWSRKRFMVQWSLDFKTIEIVDELARKENIALSRAAEKLILRGAGKRPSFSDVLTE